MSAVALLIAALGLGLAGLDPAGALIAAAALAAGTQARPVVAFGVLVVVLTALLGTALSLTVGAGLADVDWAAAVPGGPVTAAVEALAGLGALVWALARWRRSPADPADEAPRRRSPRAVGGAGLLGVGLLFTAGAALDPSYAGLVVLAGRGEPWWEVLAAHAVWSLVSQAPLVVLVVAVARGGHERAVALFTRWWGRARPLVRHLVTGALVVVGLGLLLDAGWYAATGTFLVLDPGTT